MLRSRLSCLILFSLALVPSVLATEVPSSPGQQKAAPTDQFGDPLPDGTLHRLGTSRLRHPNTRSLIFSTNGARLVSQADKLCEWDTDTGKLVWEYYHAGIEGLIASPDDRYLAGVANGAVLISKETWSQVARWQTGHQLRKTVAFTKDSKTLLGLDSEGIIHRWDVATVKETSSVSLPDAAKAVAKDSETFWTFTPDGAVVASRPANSKDLASRPWQFWDTSAGKPCRQHS
jgi:WD40 repeat protein